MKGLGAGTLVTAAFCSVALVVGACGGSDEESSSSDSGSGGGVETISLVQPVPGESTFFYPYLVGVELGFFEEEGIKVKYQSASSDLPLPAFVANGDADIADAGSDETLAAASKGGKFTVFYEEYTKTADVISVPEDSDIQSASDLAGKKVGFAGQDDRVILDTALRVSGVEPDSVQKIGIGEGGPTVAKAIQNGKIDAYASGISDKAITEALGGITLRDILPEEIKSRPAAAFAVKPETFKQRRDALVGFSRAWAKATYVGLVNRDVAEAVCRKRVPQDWENEEIATKILDLAIDPRDPGEEPFGSLRPDDWNTAQEQLIDAGEYRDPVEIDSLLDDSLLTEINDFDKAEVEAAAKAWADKNIKQ